MLEDWIDDMSLPRGMKAHFLPVKDILTWLQVLVFCGSGLVIDGFFQRLSSIADFSDLVATIQNMRSINPLQVVNIFASDCVVVDGFDPRCDGLFGTTNTKSMKAG